MSAKSYKWMKPKNVTLAWVDFLRLLQTMGIPGKLPGMSSAAPCLFPLNNSLSQGKSKERGNPTLHMDFKSCYTGSVSINSKLIW